MTQGRRWRRSRTSLWPSATTTAAPSAPARPLSVCALVGWLSPVEFVKNLMTFVHNLAYISLISAFHRNNLYFF